MHIYRSLAGDGKGKEKDKKVQIQYVTLPHLIRPQCTHTVPKE